MTDQQTLNKISQISKVRCVWYVELITSFYGDEKFLIGVSPRASIQDVEEIEKIIPVGYPYKIEGAQTIKMEISND